MPPLPLVADLHIHSHFSRATSKDLTLEHLARWAQLKGVHVVGTGDISHPGWLEELRTRLDPAEDGLFQLKPEYAAAVAAQTPAACRAPVRFLLTGEISNIYKRHGATRKVHNLVFVPALDAVERLQRRLEKIGNIRADGRPILGLDSRDLLELVLDLGDRCHFIPAHIWTPWFSMLGSKSGFNSVEECFGDLTPHIFALETGLSSDPPMNWRVGNLDRYTLVSNSDAHSPQKLAREATLFRCDLAYDALFDALRRGDPAQFAGTVEFFPEEGKYHLDGHRACGICWEPPTTIAHHGLCPVCGREITVGVMHRVEILADRPPGTRGSRAAPYHSLVPLPEVLGEVHGVGAGSRRVQADYEKLLAKLGPELYILRDAPVEEIAATGGARLAEGIRRMRSGEVVAEGGYDGEYGVIRLFAGAGLQAGTPQIGLFGAEAAAQPKRSGDAPRAGDPAPALAEAQPAYTPADPTPDPALDSIPDRGWAQDGLFATLAPPEPLTDLAPDPTRDWLAQLNDEQRAAVLHKGGPLLIVAGPGTGKTRTLTVRLAYGLRHGRCAPEQVLAITFTNKAAQEMAARLAGLVGADVAARLHVRTFHAFGLWLLQTYGDRLGLPPNPVILNDEERATLLRRAFPKLPEAALTWALDAISAAKNQLLGPAAPELASIQRDGVALPPVYAGYDAALAAAQALDFDDLILRSVRLLEGQPAVLAAVHARFTSIAVDEYQDVNLAQHRLLHLLAAGGAALSVIGDPDQAIYGFRGADRRFFLRFAADYPDTTVLRLTRSYRTPQTLLDAAAQVLAAPTSDVGADAAGGLRLWSEFTAEVKIDVHPAPTDKAEAEFVVHQIEQLVGGTSYFSLDSGRVTGLDPQARRSFGDFAVLFRLKAQARLLSEAFDRSGIPYQLVGHSPFEAQPVRELLACLWLLYNPRSRLHLDRLLSAGRSVPPPAYLDGVADAVAVAGYRLDDAFAVAASDHAFTAAQRVRLAALARAWPSFTAGGDDLPVTQRLERAQRLLAVLRGEDAAAPLPDWWRAVSLRATPFGRDLPAFLASTALAGSADEYDPRADRVPLLTLHAAKGLEFPVVFVVGCETGLLPYTPERRPATEAEIESEGANKGENEGIAEERRLLYVGITRARERLFLSYARSRLLYGRQTEPAPSPFLSDISAVLKQVQESALPRRARPDNVQLDLFA